MDARQQLVNDHLHLPSVIATTCAAELDLGGVVPLADLVAYGHQGLLEAAERYSPEAGTKFTTFSWHRIRGAVLDGVRCSGPYRRAQVNARRALEAETDPGAEKQPTEGAATAALLIQSDVPVDEIVSDDDSIETAIDARRLRARVAEAVAALPTRERQVTEMHYFQGRQFTEVAEILGITREYVSRVHGRALGRLHDVLGEPVEEGGAAR
jgi:RNA polymerase sigma factor for flagellar operon FliA